MQALQPKDRIIVALDVDSVNKAIGLVEKLHDYVGYFKIGLELITTMLVELITAETDEEAVLKLGKIRQLFRLLGGNVFWDGKFDDIPNTVGGAVKALAKLNLKMFNAHASPGIDTMLAASANKGGMLALAVTVLTSLEENDAYLSFGAPSKAKVLQFARNAKLAGFDGIVCSPLELTLLKKRKELTGFLKVTPGIRDKDSPPDDQNRTMTAFEAFVAGADLAVIGRPITSAPDPVDAAKRFAVQIDCAFQSLQKAA